MRTDEDTDKISTHIVQLREALAAKGTSQDPLLAKRDQILVFSDMVKSELAGRQGTSDELYVLDEEDQERLRQLQR